MFFIWLGDGREHQDGTETGVSKAFWALDTGQIQSQKVGQWEGGEKGREASGWNELWLINVYNVPVITYFENHLCFSVLAHLHSIPCHYLKYARLFPSQGLCTRFCQCLECPSPNLCMANYFLAYRSQLVTSTANPSLTTDSKVPTQHFITSSSF